MSDWYDQAVNTASETLDCVSEKVSEALDRVSESVSGVPDSSKSVGALAIPAEAHYCPE